MEYREIIQRVWGDWSIGEKLGEGSFGQVYFVQKERLGVVQKAAVKVVRIPSNDKEVSEIKASYGLVDSQLADFFYPEVLKYKQEIQLMQTLGENANIVQVQDFEIIEDPNSKVGWYILIRMELLESLDSFVKREEVYVGDVLNMAVDILEGIRECESHNIIHRDIKNANLFRNKKGIYKLGDFGIARDTTASSRSLSHKGTDNYMAPEVYQGKKYSNNVDLYALGIVIYKLLNKNRLPFLGEERLTSNSIERAFQLRQRGEEIPRALECSEALHRIIKKMCAYSPEERYQKAEEVLNDLDAYQEGYEAELHKVLSLPRDSGAGDIFSMEIRGNTGESSRNRSISNRFQSGNRERTSGPTHSVYENSGERSGREGTFSMYEKSRSGESSYGDYTRQMYQKRPQMPSPQAMRQVQPSIKQVLLEAQVAKEDSDLTKGNPYGAYWSNYFNFRGRTSRTGYWTVFIINTVIRLVGLWISAMLKVTAFSFLIAILWPAVNIIPDIAIKVRRLKDAGLSKYHIIWNVPEVILFAVFSWIWITLNSGGKVDATGSFGINLVAGFLISVLCGLVLFVLLLLPSKKIQKQNVANMNPQM